MSDSLYDQANELLLNDQFESSLKLFTEEIKKSPSNYTLLNCYIGRAQANIKLNRFQEALEDSEKALELDNKDWRVFHKKGLALFNLKEYKTALVVLEEGKLIAENGTIFGHLFNEWIEKSKAQLPIETVESSEPIKKAEPAEQPKPILPPTIKHEWYQSESQVTISVLAKNRTLTDVQVEYTENKLTVKNIDPEKQDFDFVFNLEYPIQAEQTQVKFMSTKIEIKLKKCEPLQWKVINITAEELAKRQKIAEKKPAYPSSSTKAKNWDAIAKEAEADEDKVEGDAALNKLFKDIYANGSEETRRAMNKSFMESGGTTLSTNWKDVGAKTLEIKPPDGMEWKKY